MLTSSFYKPAKLHFANKDISKEWFVDYYYLKPGTTDQYKRFKITLDMNRIKNANERYAYGKDVERFMNQELAQCFNPFKAINIQSCKLPAVAKQLAIIIKEHTRSASKYKIDTYNEQCNRFIRYIECQGLQDISMHEVDTDLADAYRDYIDEDLNLSVKTINTALSYLTKFWKYGIRKRWCSANPFSEVERMNKNQKLSKAEERYDPLTTKELDTIMKHLRETGQHDYMRFLFMIFYAWARPAEIARLNVSDVNLKDDLIHFPKGQTKNGQGAFVQIVPPLKKYLEEMKLEKYPPHYYLFSGDADGFKPGIRQLTRNRSSQRWNDIVKSKNGLKIQKDQYALKHTGNIQYLLMNKGKVNLKWQQMQNRHSSSVMTDRYNRKLGAYFIEVGDLNFKIFE